MFDKFGVLVQAEYLSEKEQEWTIRAFADFYHQLTPKHQKRCKLIWIEGVEESQIQKLQKIHDLKEKAVLVGSHPDKVIYFEEASLAIHLTRKHIKTVMPEAFSYGLPVLSIQNSLAAEFIDNSCGMLIHSKSEETLIEEAAMRLDMLYFDQEVLKYLKRGALSQYEKKFAWGLREFRRNRS